MLLSSQEDISSQTNRRKHRFQDELTGNLNEKGATKPPDGNVHVHHHSKESPSNEIVKNDDENKGQNQQTLYSRNIICNSTE